MAHKRAIKEYCKSASLFVLVFAFSFFAVQGLSTTSYQANILQSGVANVLLSDVKCSINERFEIPVTGESGQYRLTLDQTNLGGFYLNENRSDVRIEVDATAEDTVWFVGNKDQVIGNGTITVTDRNTDSTTTVPLRVAFPCVQSMQFCKDRTLNDSGAYECVPYNEDELTVVTGELFDVNYLEMLFYGGVRTVERLPIANIEVVDQMNDNSNGTQNVLGSGVKFAEITNENAYQSIAAKYSQNLNFSVSGVNCALENNDIYANTRAILAPDNVDFSQLPQPASTTHTFQTDQIFSIEGYTLANVRYNFNFTPSVTPADNPKEHYDVVTNSASTQSYRLYYEGESKQEQMESIVRTFSSLPLPQRVLQAAVRESNFLSFETLELGRSNVYSDTGNIWKIGLDGEVLASFNSPATAGAAGGFEYMSEYLEQFPDTMSVGDIVMAYYPGGEGHGMWSATNAPSSGSGNVVTLERIQGVVGNEALPGIDGRDSTSDKCIVSVQNSQYDITSSDYASTYSCGTDVTADIFNQYSDEEEAQEFIDDIFVAYKIDGDENAGGNVSDNQQYLEGYNYYFATVKATQPGVAMIHVNGLNCSQSKRIVVVEDAVEILVQEEIGGDAHTVPSQKLVLSVNEIVALEARYQGTEQPINPDDITWVVTDDMGGNIVELQKVSAGVDDNNVPQFEITNSLKALKRGTAFIRAKIEKEDGSYIYSKVLSVTVEQGMEVNGKGYDYTEEVYPGSSQVSFTVAGLTDDNGASRFGDLQWITDDIDYGTVEFGGNFNEILFYTPPVNDGSARLYIDHLRVIDTKTNQAINVAIHIKPPKVIQQYITTTDNQAPVVNQSLVQTQANEYAAPWIRNLEFAALPADGESIELQACTVEFDQHTIRLDVSAALDNPGGDDTAEILVGGSSIENIILFVSPDGGSTPHAVTVQNLVDAINGVDLTTQGIDVTDPNGWLAQLTASGGSTNILSDSSNATVAFDTLNASNPTQMDASFGATGFTITKILQSDLDCTDNSARVVIKKSTAELSNELVNLQVIGLDFSQAGSVVQVSGAANWNFADNTGGDIVVQSSDGKSGQTQIEYFLPNMNDIVVGDQVSLLVNGVEITTPALTSTTDITRRSEIIRSLVSQRALLEPFVVMSSQDTQGNALTAVETEISAANLERLVLTSVEAGQSFQAVVNTIRIVDTLQVPLGRAVNLKIVAVLEDGSIAEWFNSAGHLNPQVFGNPTWESTGDFTDIQGGQMIATQVGEGSISVVAPTRWYEAADSVAQVSTTGSVSWVERTQNNPTVQASIEVVPAFRVNGNYKRNYQDPEDVLALTAKTGDEIDLEVEDIATGASITWSVIENRSGLIGTTGGNDFTYTAGTKNDEGDTNVIDIIRVSDEYVSYDVHIVVNPAVIESIELERFNADPLTTLEEVNVGDEIPLTLTYTLSGGDEQIVNLGAGDAVPAELGELQWSSSDTAVVSIESGAAVALAEGVTTLTVASSISPEVSASLVITVEGRAAKFVDGATRIRPAFPAVDALINIETIVYHKDGIENVDEVAVRFDSPYLQDAILKMDDSYWEDVQNAGILPERDEEGNVEGEEVSNSDEEISSTPRQARYILDYQLPGEVALEGRTVTYVISITTNKGIRTEETVSQAGVITIGSVQSICTDDKRLSCLIRGLSCLKLSDQGQTSEECDQVISVFTQEPENFSILDVFRKYRELR